jgi:hypothetical protein
MLPTPSTVSELSVWSTLQGCRGPYLINNHDEDLCVESWPRVVLQLGLGQSVFGESAREQWKHLINDGTTSTAWLDVVLDGSKSISFGGD